MKKIMALIISVILLLALSACIGNNDIPNSEDTAAPPSPDMTSNPTPNQIPDDVSDDVSADDTAPVDGEFLYLSFGGIGSEGSPNGSNTQGLYDANVVFMGNTSETEYLDVTEFTIYIDGEPQPFTADNVTFEPGRYGFDGSNNTGYAILLYETFSETNPPIPFRPAKLWIEAVINGSTVRSRTLDWQADGTQPVLDDASISQPITLKVVEPNKPDTSDSLIVQTVITLQMNNRDAPYKGLYTGEMVDGLPHGQGTFDTTNATGLPRTYIGEWNAGHFNGEGRWEHSGNLKFEGIFENDRMVSGKMYNLGGSLYYEGEFRDGFRMEDSAAIQARIDGYAAVAVPFSGYYDDYIGQTVTAEREVVEVIPDGSCMVIRLLQTDGSVADMNYYPAYGETLPQAGNRILAYYLVYEDDGKIYQDFVAFVIL